MCRSLHPRAMRRSGFTLIEIMVATVILLIILLVLVEVSARVGTLWKSSAGRISSFQAARTGFDAITRAVSQSTLNTYFDYVDAAGDYRTIANAETFRPAGFKRASELHFMTGPAAALTGRNRAVSPGHAIFFHAPLDFSEATDLKSVPGLLNAVGFHVEYAALDDAGGLPAWLGSLFGSDRRFQLRQIVQPTENNEIYATKEGWDWIAPLLDSSTTTPGILADNVILLIIRPRLSPEDESDVAAELGASYTDETRGSILCPDYAYNSRAWQNGESFPVTVTGYARTEIMRNQIAPIVDIAMIAVDPQSFARLDMSQATPPAILTPPEDSFADSSQMELDLENFENQLADGGVRFRTFRTSVPVHSSKWSNSF